MGYIRVITHLLTIDPILLGHPSITSSPSPKSLRWRTMRCWWLRLVCLESKNPGSQPPLKKDGRSFWKMTNPYLKKMIHPLNHSESGSAPGTCMYIWTCVSIYVVLSIHDIICISILCTSLSLNLIWNCVLHIQIIRSKHDTIYIWATNKHSNNVKMHLYCLHLLGWGQPKVIKHFTQCSSQKKQLSHLGTLKKLSREQQPQLALEK